MNSHIFLWSSENILSIKTSIQGFFFIENNLIFGNDGLSEYLNQGNNLDDIFNHRNGKFALTIVDKNEIKILSDFFGSELIFYYYNSKNKKWAISNSFNKLKEYIYKMKWDSELYLPTACTYMMPFDGLFSGQLMSNNSLLKNIQLLPLNNYINISENGFKIQKINSDISEYGDLSYQEYINIFIQSAHDRMLAFYNLVDANAFVDLSGGQDSRLNFGICMKSNSRLKNVMVRSNKNAIEDYKVASKVTEYYRTILTSSTYNGKRITGDTAYNLWKDSNLGVYRPIYLPITEKPRKLVHFDGANFLAKAYLTKNPYERLEFWKSKLKGYSKSIYQYIEEEFISSFQKNNININSVDAMEQHYLHQRARIHGGRATYKNLQAIIYSPLMSTEFYKVVLKGSKHGFSKDQIMCDVITSIDKQLSKFPFSNEKSQFSESIIDSSLKRMSQYKIQNQLEPIYFGKIDLVDNITSSKNDDFYNILINQVSDYSNDIINLDLFYCKKSINTLLKNLKTEPMANDWMNASSIISIGSIIKSY